MYGPRIVQKLLGNDPHGPGAPVLTLILEHLPMIRAYLRVKHGTF